MRKSSRKTEYKAIYKQLAEVRLSEHDRQRAAYDLCHAEAIADAVIWVKESIASLGAMLGKPRFKHKEKSEVWASCRHQRHSSRLAGSCADARSAKTIPVEP